MNIHKQVKFLGVNLHCFNYGIQSALSVSVLDSVTVRPTLTAVRDRDGETFICGWHVRLHVESLQKGGS